MFNPFYWNCSSQNGSQTQPKSMENQSKSAYGLKNVNFSKIAPRLCKTLIFEGPGFPNPCQNPLKNVQDLINNPIKISTEFWIDFWLIFVSFWHCPGAPFGRQNHSKSCFGAPNGLSKSNLLGTRRPTIHHDSLKVDRGSSTDGFRPNFALIFKDFSLMLQLFGAPSGDQNESKSCLWELPCSLPELPKNIKKTISKIPSRISTRSSKV